MVVHFTPNHPLQNHISSSLLIAFTAILHDDCLAAERSAGWADNQTFWSKQVNSDQLSNNGASWIKKKGKDLSVCNLSASRSLIRLKADLIRTSHWHPSCSQGTRREEKRQGEEENCGDGIRDRSWLKTTQWKKSSSALLRLWHASLLICAYPSRASIPLHWIHKSRSYYPAN